MAGTLYISLSVLMQLGGTVWTEISEPSGIDISALEAEFAVVDTAAAPDSEKKAGVIELYVHAYSYCMYRELFVGTAAITIYPNYKCARMQVPQK
jgi:hypothetical protein